MAMPSEPGGEPLVIDRFSTDHLPPGERYDAWLARDWPRGQSIFRTQPIEPFDTRWESAQLGPILFAHVVITGQRWERRLQDIRTSDYDPIIISMLVEGERQGDMDGRIFRERAGTFSIHDLARPSLHVSTASRTYGLVLPRPLAREWLGDLHDLHGLIIPAERAEILIAHAAQVQRLLPQLSVASAERLGRSLLETTIVALAGVRAVSESPASPAARLRRRAEEAIEARLGAGRISVAELCEAVGTSRARLFAAFHPDGGVQHFVMRVRLNRARVALGELDRGEPIGTIAERLGFSDASHLSRTFRERYGMTPREYRTLLLTDRAALSEPD
jgi:AraC-like DNA-binding protein